MRKTIVFFDSAPDGWCVCSGMIAPKNNKD